MKISKEVRIGIFAIIVIIAFIMGINFVKNKRFFSNDKVLYTIYNDASGLQKSSSLILRGLVVGKITDISFYNNNTDKILIEFSLNNKINIPKDSKIQLFSPDLLGSKSLQILLGSSSENVQNGDTLLSDVALSLTDQVGSQVVPLKEKAERLVVSFDSTLTSINEVLNPQTRENLRSSISSLESTLKNLNDVSVQINSIVGENKNKFNTITNDIQTFSSKLSDYTANLDKVLNNFASITDTLNNGSLASTLKNLKTSTEDLKVITNKINSNQGSIGKAINDDELILSLENSIKNLDALLIDIKQNPKRYINVSVFGGSKNKE